MRRRDAWTTHNRNICICSSKHWNNKHWKQLWLTLPKRHRLTKSNSQPNQLYARRVVDFCASAPIYTHGPRHASSFTALLLIYFAHLPWIFIFIITHIGISVAILAFIHALWCDARWHPESLRRAYDATYLFRRLSTGGPRRARYPVRTLPRSKWVTLPEDTFRE